MNTSTEITTRLLESYKDKIWILSLIYYNSETDVYIEIPKIPGKNYDSTIPHPTQQKLEAAGGTLVYDAYNFKASGVVTIMEDAVYGPDGEYRGYVAMVFKEVDFSVKADYLHPTNETGNYNTIIVNKASNLVTYTSSGEYVGQSAEYPLSGHGQDSGAVTYTRVIRTIYGSEAKEMLAAWKTYTLHGEKHLHIIEKEVTPTQVDTNRLLRTDMEGLKSVVTDAYSYGISHGVNGLTIRINTGQYDTDTTRLYLLDKEGTILAASVAGHNHIGFSYKSIIDPYGVSFIEQMIYTSGHGSGYIGYYLPADFTQEPASGIFMVAYVISNGNNWYLAGVAPVVSNLSAINHEVRVGIMTTARTFVSDALTNGTSSVITQIQENHKSLSAEQKLHATSYGIIGYDGYVYASLIGDEKVSGLAYVDALQTSIVRNMIRTAKDGGGMMYSVEPDEIDPDILNIRLYAIEPVDDTYFVVIGEIVDSIPNFLKNKTGATGTGTVSGPAS